MDAMDAMAETMPCFPGKSPAPRPAANGGALECRDRGGGSKRGGAQGKPKTDQDAPRRHSWILSIALPRDPRPSRALVGPHGLPSSPADFSPFVLVRPKPDSRLSNLRWRDGVVVAVAVAVAVVEVAAGAGFTCALTSSNSSSQLQAPARTTTHHPPPTTHCVAALSQHQTPTQTPTPTQPHTPNSHTTRVHHGVPLQGQGRRPRRALVWRPVGELVAHSRCVSWVAPLKTSQLAPLQAVAPCVGETEILTLTLRLTDSPSHPQSPSSAPSSSAPRCTTTRSSRTSGMASPTSGSPPSRPPLATATPSAPFL